MAIINKPKVVKDYDKLAPEIVEQIKLKYPRGFVFHLFTYKDHKGKFVSALPFETEDRHYLIRMTVSEAQAIIEDDDDYDDDGILKEEIKDELTEKFDDEMEGEFDDDEDAPDFDDDDDE